ncbi:MAG: PepSY domain-containing protein [Putridiphycobacter sp.]
MKKNTSMNMRILHRYLGFFLAGIMAVYAISGILLIFRETDFLKSEIYEEKQLEANLTAEQLGPQLRMRVKVDKTEAGVMYFRQGTYNTETGLAKTTRKELPTLLKKMEHLHKSSTDSPLFFLNIFFGLALLFFVISAFYMYLPKTSIFKKGIYFSLAGMVLVLILLWV